MHSTRGLNCPALRSSAVTANPGALQGLQGDIDVLYMVIDHSRNARCAHEAQAPSDVDENSSLMKTRDCNAITSFRFGFVETCIGDLQQFLAARCVFWIGGDANGKRNGV